MSSYSPETLIARRYEIVSQPLKGGMGIVYLCYDQREQRPIALKTFYPEFLPNLVARDRFLREGNTWVHLGKHPHIVQAYRVERIDDGTEVYLVLELIAKEEHRKDASLRSYIVSGKPLNTKTALLFALQIVRGMKYAVEILPGFVHRDLKPENILVGADKLPDTNINRLRVSDFGLAKILESSVGTPISKSIYYETDLPNLRHNQLTQGVVGTPLYISPERWQGRELGIWADIYAFGCILYEMLTGEHAVVGKTPEEVKQAHCKGHIAPLPHDLPIIVGDIIKQCLALDYKKRNISWGELEIKIINAYSNTTGNKVPAPLSIVEQNRSERLATGWSFSEIGASYLDISKIDIALGYFKRAIEIGKIENEPALEAAGLGNLGNAHMRISDLQNAIPLLEQTLTAVRKTKSRRAEAATLSNLGVALLRSGDYETAIELQEQAIVIYREEGDRTGVADAMGNLGKIHLELGKVQKAIPYLEECLKILHETNDLARVGVVLSNLGIAYYEMKRLPEAMDCHEKRLQIAHSLGDRVGEANAFSNLGLIYLSIDPIRAVNYFTQGMGIYRDINNRYGEGNTLLNLGNIYYQSGDNQSALDSYAKAFSLQEEIGDLMGLARTAYNLAQLLYEAGDVGEALYYAKRSVTIFERIGHQEKARQARSLLIQIRTGQR